MWIKSLHMVFPGCIVVASAWVPDVRDAIAQEFQLKKWSRVNKIRLTNRLNSHWEILVLMCHESNKLRDLSTMPCSARIDVEHY
jgi:hypothetical protein